MGRHFVISEAVFRGISVQTFRWLPTFHLQRVKWRQQVVAAGAWCQSTGGQPDKAAFPSDAHSSLRNADSTLRSPWVSFGVGRSELAVPVCHPTATRYGNRDQPSHQQKINPTYEFRGEIKMIPF